MTTLYLDAMFHSSNINSKTLPRFVTFKNFNYLQGALEKGQGAIIPTLHVGMFFQVLASLAYYRPKIEVITVIQPRNKMMYENVLTRPELTNFHTVPATSFSKLRPILLDHLRKNHVLVVYHDYSKAHQLRVPFLQGQYPYLITSPQSIFKLHKESKSPIIPALLSPDDVFGRSIIEFQNPQPFYDIANQYQNQNEKIYYGEMSIYLNKIFSPHLRKFNHIWEEFRKFTTRTSDFYEFPDYIKLSDLVQDFENKITNIIRQSYERERPDKTILQLIHNHCELIQSSLESPRKMISGIGQKVDLSLMSAISEIIELIELFLGILQMAHEKESANHLTDLKKKLSKF
jgi:hypothetical protein